MDSEHVDNALQLLASGKLSVNQFRDIFVVQLKHRKRKRPRKKNNSNKAAKRKKVSVPSARRKQREKKLRQTKVFHEEALRNSGNAEDNHNDVKAVGEVKVVNLLSASLRMPHQMESQNQSDQKKTPNDLYDDVDFDRSFYLHRKEFVQTISELKKISVKSGKLPICIITGPYGSGKTTFVKIVAKELKQSVVNIDLTGGCLTKAIKRQLSDNILQERNVCIVLDYIETWKFDKYSELITFLLKVYGSFNRRKYKPNPNIASIGSRLYIILNEYPFTSNPKHPISIMKEKSTQVHLCVTSEKLRILQSYLFRQHNVSLSDDFKHEQSANGEHVNLNTIISTAKLMKSSHLSNDEKKRPPNFFHEVKYDMVENRSKPSYFKMCEFVLKPSLYFSQNMSYLDYVDIHVDESQLMRLVANNYITFAFLCGLEVYNVLKTYTSWLVDMDYLSHCPRYKPYWKQNKIWMLMRLFYILKKYPVPKHLRLNVSGLSSKSVTQYSNNAQRLVGELLFYIAPIQKFYYNQKIKSSDKKLIVRSNMDYVCQYHPDSKQIFTRSNFYRLKK